MYILDRYIAREILRTFGLALCTFAVVFLLATLYELLREGYTPGLVLTLLPFAVAYTTPYLVPVALLIGCALAYGRLAADNEVTPMLAAGLPPRALLKAGVVIGLATSILLGGAQATLVPYAYARKKGVLKKILEDLAALPVAESKRLGDPRRGFFFYARRTDGADLEGLELALFPGIFQLAGGEARGAGRVELTAERGHIRKSAAGGLEVEVEDARVTYFSTPNLRLSDFDDAAGSGRLDAAEWSRFMEAVRGGAGGAGVAAAPSWGFAAADQNGDGGVDGNELKLWLSRLDLTELPTRSISELRLSRFTFEIAPETRTSFRLEFRPDRDVAALRARLEGFAAFAALAEARAAARGEAAALAAGLAGAGVAPAAAPLAAAAVVAASPGPFVVEEARRLDRRAEAVLHERWVLSLAPALFALIGSAVPLLLQSNHRLVPLFVAFLIAGATFYAPFLAGLATLDKGRGPPALVLWIAPALAALVGLGLAWRIGRR